jgi:hypothetical protein
MGCGASAPVKAASLAVAKRADGDEIAPSLEGSTVIADGGVKNPKEEPVKYTPVADLVVTKEDVPLEQKQVGTVDAVTGPATSGDGTAATTTPGPGTDGTAARTTPGPGTESTPDESDGNTTVYYNEQEDRLQWGNHSFSAPMRGGDAEEALRLAVEVANAFGDDYLVTWDNGKTFRHDKSLQPEHNAQRVAAEQEVIKAIEVLDAVRAPSTELRDSQLVSRGVTVRFLKRMAAEHPGLYTYEMVSEVVKPATRRSRCRYAELPEMAGDVGVAKTFISHTWKVLFADTVEAVAHILPDDAIVWMDIWAVRQWPGNTADLAFDSVVRDTSALILCSIHIEALMQIDTMALVRKEGCALPEELLKMNAFFRVWCLVELMTAINFKKSVIMLIGSA